MGIASQLYFLTMKLEKGELINEHVIKFAGIIRKLYSVGAKLQKTWISYMRWVVPLESEWMFSIKRVETGKAVV